ncbi:MAG: hypothetical protein ACLU4J_16460 [Butyricimonas paravirosa]
MRLGDENELSFLAEWRAPYKEWKEKKRTRRCFRNSARGWCTSIWVKEFAEADRWHLIWYRG